MNLDLVPRPAVDSSDQELIDGQFSAAIDTLSAMRLAFERRRDDMNPNVWLTQMMNLDRALIWTRHLLCECGRHVATSDAGCAACAERSAK